VAGGFRALTIQGRFELITTVGVVFLSALVFSIIGWSEYSQIETRLSEFSRNELDSLHALVLSTMLHRKTDNERVAIAVFNDWFEHRNKDYPGRLWSVWGTNLASHMASSAPNVAAKPPRDEVDAEALRSGLPVGRIVGDTYRYSMPIVLGVTSGTENGACMTCHGKVMGDRVGSVVAVFSSSLPTEAEFDGLKQMLAWLSLAATLVTVVVLTVVHLAFDHLTEQVRLLFYAVEQSPTAVVITDLQGRIEYVNSTFCANSGYGKDEVIGANPRIVKSGVNNPQVYESLWKAITSGGTWDGDICNRRKDGSHHWEHMTVSPMRNSAGTMTHFVAFKEDQTTIRHLAYHDALTDLPNRALFGDRLEHALELAGRNGTRVAIVFIDLDHFKAINDTLGHDAGDLLLQEVARRARAAVRATDTIARMGGDEFIVLMESVGDAEDIGRAIQKLAAELTRPMDLMGQPHHVTASLGVAIYPEDGADVRTLMKHADVAMYAAKSQGRDTTQFFSAEIMEKTTQSVRFERDLRMAVDNGDFELHYQPKLRLDDGAVCGVEALVRWRHPEHGLIPPTRFIPVAETTGLIVRLGEWVIEEACRQAVAWRDGDGRRVPVAINVSALQLFSTDFSKRLADITARHGAAPRDIEIEITESAVMSDPEQAARVLGSLSEQGFGIAQDDFGTGYSSLSYLSTFPFDTVKIDRSFVTGASSNAKKTQIVGTIVQLCNLLGMTVVAEGIETEQEALMLRNARCAVGQGYYFAQPMEAVGLARWLRENATIEA